MNRMLATDRLSGLAAVLAGLWVLRHFGYGFWGYVLASLLWLPGLVALLASEPISQTINRIVAPLDPNGSVAEYINALLSPIQALADRVDGIHRKAAFKVFALWLAIGLSVLALALLLLGILMTAIGQNLRRSWQPTGLVSSIASQKEAVDIEVQYENSCMWEPRDSCSNYEQEISLELRRILERPAVHRARAIGRVSHRVYDTLQK